MSKDAPDLIDEILNNNLPSNLSEYVLNIGGIGKLLQALYNTPISKRKAGLSRSIENVTKAIDYIESEEETLELKFWRTFSKYSLMQIMSNFFAHNHWSITLVEPMKQLFDEKLALSESDSRNDNDDFQMYLLSTILASDDFSSYSELRRLFEKKKWIGINLLALIHTHLLRLRNSNKELLSSDEDLKYLSKKLTQRLRGLGDISDKVNVPLNKKLLEKQAGNKG